MCSTDVNETKDRILKTYSMSLASSFLHFLHFERQLLDYVFSSSNILQLSNNRKVSEQKTMLHLHFRFHLAYVAGAVNGYATRYQS